MSEKSTACVQCGAAMEQLRRGRPKAYCGPGCRGAAGYELKRLQRRLEGLEVRCADLRTQDDRGPRYRDYAGRDLAGQLAAIETQITEAQARLRALLSAAPATPAGKDDSA